MDLAGMKKSRKACIVKSGKKKGKLKKGFRFSTSGRCVKAKAKKAPAKAKKSRRSSMRKMTAAEARSFSSEMRAASKRPGVIVGSF